MNLGVTSNKKNIQQANKTTNFVFFINQKDPFT